MAKILWLSHLVPYPPNGGVMQRSYNLIREISKYHDVHLLAFNQKEIISSEPQLSEARNHFESFCSVVDFLPIPSELTKLSRLLLLLSGLVPRNTYTINWLRSKQYKIRLDELLKKEKFDLIHVDTISLVPYVLHLKNTVLVLNHHNIESLMMIRRSENEGNILKKFYFRYEGYKLIDYERKICSLFRLNITCSSLDSDRLRNLIPDITCVDVPNGVDLDFFNPIKVEKVKKSLVFAGGLNWYPNLDAIDYFMNNVWDELNKEIPDISLTIIGKSPPARILELQRLYKNLKVTGFVSDVRPFLSASHIYICPIRDGGGTKLKVLDALAMQIPLIADPIACEGIDVKDRESVMFASTPDEYIACIKELLNDDELCNKIAFNGRKLIEERYGFKALGIKLSGVYDSLTEA